MLSRAYTKPRKSPRARESQSKWDSSQSLYDYEDGIVGFMEDLPLTFCHRHDSSHHCDCQLCGTQLSLKDVMHASVGVMGESQMGISEKVVLSLGRFHVVKRFRKVVVKKAEFGKRVERLAQLSRRSDYLVPVTAYLHTKRFKFVLCAYYPMGSLADLLAGGRELGHTALLWIQRLKIIIHIAQAISFIHSLTPHHEKHFQMNVHGNIKASNVMINVDFSACLSDYGFAQLAERVEFSNTTQQKPSPTKRFYSNKLFQQSDIYNFGVIVLDLLGGSMAPELKDCIVEKKEKIKDGVIPFFEFAVEGKERKQALQVLDIALSCVCGPPDTRPAIDQILVFLGDALSYR